MDQESQDYKLKDKDYELKQGEYIVDMGGFCNCRCKHCFVSNRIIEHKPIDLQKIMKEITYSKATRVNIFGGEPTIQKEFFPLLKYSKSLGLFTSLSTNGRMLSYKPFIEKLKREGIDFINVSLYGDTKEIHDNITQVKGSFDQTIKGIQNIVKSKLNFSITIVIMKQNYEQLINIVKKLNEIKVNRIKFSLLVYVQNAKTHFREIAINMDKVQPHLIKAIQYAEKNDMVVRIEKTPMCMLPEYTEYFILENTKNNVWFKEGPLCNKCSFYDNCVKFDKVYLYKFGYPQFYKEFTNLIKRKK